MQNSNSSTELVFEHQLEEDQICVQEDIVIRFSSSYIDLSEPSLNPHDYHFQIWKPPVNS
jgi:hypothetical protein